MLEEGELGGLDGRGVRRAVGVPPASRCFRIQYRSQALSGFRRAFLSPEQRTVDPWIYMETSARMVLERVNCSYPRRNREQGEKFHGDSDPEGPGWALSLCQGPENVQSAVLATAVG